MPNVISYTPPWLSQPSPGASLFSSTPSKIPDYGLLDDVGRDQYTGPVRTLAKRGGEVFAVVDSMIRWASLTRLKDEWQQKTKEKKESTGQDQEVKGVHYRVCGTAAATMALRMANGQLDLECACLRANPANNSFS